MTTAQISMIAPPPSVEAVLGALTEETRIGQVDFSSRLAPEPEPEQHEVFADAEPEPGVEPEVEPAVEVAAGAGVETADEPDEPADEADEPSDEAYAQPVADVVTLTLAAVPPLPEERPTKPKKSKKRDLPQAEPAEDAAMNDTHSPIEDRITGPAHLTASARMAQPTPTGDAERPPSIEEIARAVVERMHDAELAMMRHLEAIELEADRRAELATAQAELDAELIRLNARREAHAIVTAAREEAGQPTADDAADRALDEVTESLTRFADVMEELRPSHRPGRRP